MDFKKIHTAVFIGLMLIFSAHANAAEIPGTPFAIDPPPGWQANTGGAMGTLIYFVDAPRDEFSANINVIPERVGDTTLDEYYEVFYKNLQKIVTNFKLIKREKIVIGNIPLGTIEYTGTQGKYDLHLYQVFMIYKGYALLFSGTTLQKYADEYIPIIKKSFETIREAPPPKEPPTEAAPIGGGKER